MKISMRIRIARQRARLSQEALAVRMGVTRGAVANWECSVGALPASSRLELLARVTGVCFEWLATGRGGRWIGGDDETPAMMLNFYAPCGLEERLLIAFRSLRSLEQQPLVDFVEAMTDRS